MFIEPTYTKKKKGWIEVICGPMFSGKSEELIRRLTRARIANLKVEIFKPQKDTRYDETNIVSHNQNSIQSTPVDTSQTILLLAQNVDVIGIDEAQFFDEELPNVCETLAGNGIRVILAGLDKDYLGKPFQPMPELLALGDFVTKLHAICIQCGSLATHSYRLTESKDRVLLGETDAYEARCRSCFVEGMKAVEDLQKNM